MRVAVIGTGYVGLVSGSCLAELGHQVIGVDTDTQKIDRLRSGIMPIFEPGLEELVKRNVAAGRLQFTSSYAEAIPGAEVISIAVGTPSMADGSVDMQYIYSAAQSIAKHLTGYAVIADKSTVPVGTAEEVMRIVREAYAGECDVVSNPEVLREGHAVQDFLHPSRIVIGSNVPRATEVIQKLYSFISCEKIVMSVRSAELTKYAANAFLATKISFINEIAHLAEILGADIEEVAHGIGTDPRIGRDFLRAGLGWGGSCFPKDVRALQHIANKHSHPLPIVSAALHMNDRARTRIIDRLEQILKGLPDKTIAILGLSFKNNTDDTRESAALDLIKQLNERGAKTHGYDPAAVIFDPNISTCLTRFPDPYQALEHADAILIATEWDEFRVLNFERIKGLMRGDVVMDGRNLLDPKVVRRTGLRYFGVGRGSNG